MCYSLWIIYDYLKWLYATWRTLDCHHVHNEKWVFIWTWLYIYIYIYMCVCVCVCVCVEVQTRTLAICENARTFAHPQNHMWFYTNEKKERVSCTKSHVILHMWFCLWIIYDFVRELYMWFLYVNHMWFCIGDGTTHVGGLVVI